MDVCQCLLVQIFASNVLFLPALTVTWSSKNRKNTVCVCVGKMRVMRVMRALFCRMDVLFLLSCVLEFRLKITFSASYRPSQHGINIRFSPLGSHILPICISQIKCEALLFNMLLILQILVSFSTVFFL